MVLKHSTESRIVAVIGKPQTGKTRFCYGAVLEAVRSGKKALVIITNLPYSEVLDNLGSEGKSAESAGNLTIMDCYSWRVGLKTEAKYAVGQLDDLSHLSALASKLMKDFPKRSLIVLDSVTTLTLHSKPEDVIKFLDVAFALARKSDLKFLAVVEDGAHDAGFVARIKSLADDIVETDSEPA